MRNQTRTEQLPKEDETAQEARLHPRKPQPLTMLEEEAGVYRAASAIVYRAANAKDAAEVARPNPSQRRPDPKSPQ
jgi:hypothetical protein